MIVAGIPADNEEKTIAKVILLAQRHVDVVIVCDDGSQDLTADIAQRLSAIVIRHEKNLGYGAAIQHTTTWKKPRKDQRAYSTISDLHALDNKYGRGMHCLERYFPSKQRVEHLGEPH